MNSTTTSNSAASTATSHYRFKPFNVGRFVIWTLFAVMLIVAPMLFRSSLALTMLSQIGYLIIICLSYLILEVVQLVWGRSTVPYGLPEQLQGPLFSLYGTQFPKSRSFVMLVALVMLVSVWLLLTRTRIGLVIQAALKYPEMVEALGHNVPRVFMLVFGGGAALAGLAGVIGGNTYVTEPAMAASVGSIIFVVVVVGGMGSLAGAFLASLLIGLVQTFAVALDYSLIHAFQAVGVAVTEQTFGYPLLKLTISQVAPILPYLFLVLILIFRPKGLLGKRED